MIATYRDLDRDQRFSVAVIDSTAQSGFLLKPRKGFRFVIETIEISIQGAANATTVYDLQLCTVDSTGVPSPAGPTIFPLSDNYRTAPASATVNISLTDARTDLNIEVPEGMGIGWYCQTGAIGGRTYATPSFINLAVQGRLVPVASRDSALAASVDSPFLQPQGSGL